VYPIAEFRAVALRAVRRGAFTILSAVGTLLLFGVTAVHLSDPWGRGDLACRLALVWGTVGMAALTLTFEVLAVRARHPFTRCPHCRGKLADGVPLVVASGCCFRCGRRVLEPPADDPPADALVPRADYLTADAKYQRRAAPLLMAGMFACYLGCGGAVVSLRALDLPFPFNWAVFVGLALVAPVSVVAAARFLWASGKQNPALACPTCGKLIAGGRMIVAATGHCHECGCQAVVPRTRPLAPPHLGPFWTVPRLNQVEKRRRGYTVRLFVLLGLVTVATYGLVIVGKLMWEEERLREMGLNRPAAQWVEKYGAWVAAATGLVVAAVVARRSPQVARRKHPHDCPRCGRELLPAFAVATKCCNKCGWQVVRG
jgi:ribosomal protein L37AE/L43A